MLKLFIQYFFQKKQLGETILLHLLVSKRG